MVVWHLAQRFKNPGRADSSLLQALQAWVSVLLDESIISGLILNSWWLDEAGVGDGVCSKEICYYNCATFRTLILN